MLNVLSKKIYERYIFEEFPTNVMGNSSSTSGTGNIDTFDPLQGMKNRLLKRKKPITKKAIDFKIKL
jgi:hypothetical protein